MTHYTHYRKCEILLDSELVSRLYDWHSGQRSAVYSLASTGDHNLVSLSMIDRALVELRSVYRKEKPGKGKRELSNLIGDLSNVRVYWRESSAKEAGMGLSEGEYGYDAHGYEPDEGDLEKEGEWANPRKAMASIRKRRVR